MNETVRAAIEKELRYRREYLESSLKTDETSFTRGMIHGLRLVIQIADRPTA